MDDLLLKPAGSLVADMAAGRVSAVELMTATLDRIEAVNPSVNAIVALRDRDALLAEAAAADAVPVEQRGPLHGLPTAAKDLTDVAGLPTSMGSKAVPLVPAKADGLMISRMRAAGAIFIGKTNVPEFGLGSHTFNPVYGTTLNAYDDSRSAGGSSGGAAVALATGMMSIADGSDMMGSLRNPAAWGNVYGFRPSVGLVPNEPMGDAYLHRLATLGPMARCPQDISRLLAVQAGDDPRFPGFMPGYGAEALTSSDLKGKRLGWLPDWGGVLPFEPGLLELSETAAQRFEALGATVDRLEAPFPREALWEAWVTLRHFSVAMSLDPLMANPATRDVIKQDALWEYENGMALTAAQLQKASVQRSAWFRKAAELFDTYDALLMPTTQVWPFPKDMTRPSEIAGVAMDSYHRWMEVVIPVSLIGLPSLNVPIGFGDNGLPAGLQIAGRFGADRKVLEIGEAWHRATDWPNARPAKMHAKRT